MISFKGALDTIVANTARYLRRQGHVRKIREIWESTVGMIGEKIINLRAFRREPRAQKKRPKTFSYLTAPRSKYREIPHREKTPGFRLKQCHSHLTSFFREKTLIRRGRCSNRTP